MTWSYDAGHATPGLLNEGHQLPGVVSSPSIRFGDGTFRLLSVPPFVQTPPLRITTHPSPFHDGAVVPEPRLDAWQFDITGKFVVADWTEVQAATDYLLAHVNNALGWQTWSFYAYSWSAAKTISCRVAGQVTVSGGDAEGEMYSVERGFTLPLIAAVPVLT